MSNHMIQYSLCIQLPKQFAVLVDPSKNKGKGLKVKGRVMPVGMQFVNIKLSLKFFTQTSVC